MPVILACPKCNQKVRVPTDKGELAIRCPKCEHRWNWSPNADVHETPTLQSDLYHYTLNTGHAVPVARTHVPEYAMDQAKSLLTNGRHPIKLVSGGYECDVTIVKHALLATVYQGDRPLVSFGVAPDIEAAHELWMIMIGNYGLFMSDLLKSSNHAMRTLDQVVNSPPESVPWCAVICLLIQDGEFWLANFEQMLAWAWIEKVRATSVQ